MMANVREFYRIDTVQSKVIHCDHCDLEIRIDWSSENNRTSEQTVNEEARAKARAAGWRSIELRSHSVVNLCPDHAHQYDEMGLIKK